LVGIKEFLSGITVSGGEATEQLDFIKALFTQIKEHPDLGALTTFIDSNGTASVDKWKKIIAVLDGAMIDLKAFNADSHRLITGQGNKKVLETISYLDRQDKLHEVRFLIIPGLNDDKEELKAGARYLAGLENGINIRLIPFRQHGVREEYSHLEEASGELMEQVKEIFLAYQFNEVYIT
jgi:pyruvate-formate lyase-activating enzyme